MVLARSFACFESYWYSYKYASYSRSFACFESCVVKTLALLKLVVLLVLNRAAMPGVGRLYIHDNPDILPLLETRGNLHVITPHI